MGNDSSVRQEARSLGPVPQESVLVAKRTGAPRKPSYAELPEPWRDRDEPGSRGYLIAKRVLDVVGAAIGLVLLAPIMLAIGVAIKLDSPGPILYSERRHGRYGRPFVMYKLRSMVVGAEAFIQELSNEVDGPMFKMRYDPRVTRVGRFLRRTNMDELPQLWNVLKGDMTLVGPRPLAMEEMRGHRRWRGTRLTVEQGLTGLWQVEAQSKFSFSEWIRHDISYVRNRTLWLDLKILLKTLVLPFRRRAKSPARLPSDE